MVSDRRLDAEQCLAKKPSRQPPAILSTQRGLRGLVWTASSCSFPETVLVFIARKVRSAFECAGTPQGLPLAPDASS